MDDVTAYTLSLSTFCQIPTQFSLCSLLLSLHHWTSLKILYHATADGT